MQSTKSLFLPCEYCPVGTVFKSDVACCRECKAILFITCPHDGFDLEVQRCTDCTDRIFSESTMCGFHFREMHYFCLDCVRGVCSECLVPSAAHGGHRFQKLGTLYTINMKQVLCMMSNLSVSISNTNIVKRQIAKNLELVEVNEQSLLADLEGLYETAKQSIRASAIQRKTALKEKLAVDFAAPRDILEREIYSLSKYELIKLHPSLIKHITQQMAACVGYTHQEVDSYGFECPLIPRLTLSTVRIDNITKRKVPVQLAITDSSGFPWTAMVAVFPWISVQLFPKDETLECFPHRVVFEIVHRDLAKTLRRSFTITDLCEEMTLCEDVKFLRANGFLLQNNVIVLRIGIRSSSLVVENELLKVQQEKKQEATMELEEESSEQNVCCSSFLHLPLSENEAEEVPSSVRIHSDAITDAFGHRWCLRVKRVARSVRSKIRVMLGVYIVQLDAVRCRCKYFIILHNKDPSKRMHTSGEEEFSAMDQNFGKNACIDVADLTEESGFVFDGMLRFQFGVTPITSNGTVIEVAHFTESNQLVTKTILK